jgi:aldose 1-epimerase
VSVAREPWGTTSHGEPVELFTLEQGALRARIASFGATLVSLEVPDRRGERVDVVLGFDTLARYDSPANPYFGALVGRCANRIAGARFTLDGREHVLAANEGRNHLHGGLRGFDRRVWAAEPGPGAELALRYRSPDGEEGYPGTLEVCATYTLAAPHAPTPAGSQVLGLRTHAHADAPTPCNLLSHAYFNLAGAGTILDHVLEVRASRYVVVDEALLPTGALASVANTPFDFRTPRRIGERLDELLAGPARGYDVCLVLDASGLHAPAARLHEPRTGRTLELWTDQPGLQLYSGNRLGDLRDKNGAVYAPFGGLCLEAQGLPDALHHAGFPSLVLRPGEPYQAVEKVRAARLPPGAGLIACA